MNATVLTKVLKRLLSITLTLAGIGLAVYALLELGRYYSGDILYQVVQRETAGRYRLSYENLEFDIWEKVIRVENIMLQPDSSADLQSEELSNLFTLEVAALQINLESIWSVYFDRELLIDKVRIIDPDLRMVRNPNAPAQSFSLQTGNLYGKISQYLQVLKIGQFSAENAQFEHLPSHFSLGRIDLLVRNLLMDSSSRPDERFFSENIELEIRDQAFNLNDSLHRVTFDSFILSTADSILTFKNFAVKPDSTLIQTLQEQGDFVIYNISIPELELRGVDYFTAYRKDHLNMEELAIINPSIMVDDETYTNPNRKNVDNSLLKEIIEVFEEVHIGRLRSINSRLSLTTNKDHYDYQHIESERAHIVLYEVNLNENNYRFSPQHRYFENIEVIINDYYSQLSDSVHTVSFDQLEVSSIDSTLIFEGLAIDNTGIEGETSSLYSFHFPLVALRGVDYQEALNQQNLLLKHIDIRNPRIQFNPVNEGGNQLPEIDEVYQSIKNVFRTINFNRMELNSGSLALGKEVRAGEVNMDVTGFHIDATTTTWQELTEDFGLSLHDLEINNDQLQMKGDTIQVNHSFDELNLRNWSFSFLGLEDSVTGSLDSLHLTGVEIDSLLAGQYYAFDSVLLFGPELELKISNPGGNNQHPFQNQFIQVSDGRIQATLDSSSFSVSGVNMAINFGENFDLQGSLSGLEFNSTPAGHLIKVDSLEIPEHQIIHLSDIQILPLDRQERPVQLNSSIPDLSIYGMDQMALFNDNRFYADSLVIASPDIMLHRNPGDTAIAGGQPFPVSLGKLHLLEAKVAVHDHTQEKLEQVGISDLSVELRDFNFPSQPWIGPESILASQQVRIRARDLSPVMTHGDTLFIRQFHYNSDEEVMRMDSATFRNAANSVSLGVPRLQIIGLDLDSLVNHDRVRFDHSSLTFDNLLVKSWLNQDSTAVKDMSFRSGVLQLGGYAAPVALDWRNWINQAETTHFEGRGLNLPMPDYHTLEVSRYSYDKNLKTLSLTGAAYQSDLTPDQYRNYLTYQKDWFDLKADSITMHGLNLATWLLEENYIVRKVDVNGLRAIFYRDKTLPLQENRRVKLPQSIFLDTKTRIYIDTLRARGDIIYQEKLRETTDEVGEMTFNDLDANLLHITTIDSLATRPMRLVSSGKLMHIAPFEAAVTFNMQDPNDNFVFIGEVNELPLTELNKLFVPLAGISIKSGYSKRALFTIKADNNVAKGQMRLRYNDLKIQILNPETHDTRGLGQGLKTFFANTFAVKNNNPTFLILRNGQIFYERDHSKAIFNYWGKAILSGAVSSVGINKSKKAERDYEKGPREK